MLVVVLATTVLLPSAFAQKFIHPGIDQSAQDLAYMKQQVLKGEQPWKDAFDRLKAATDLTFEVKPHTHVLRGPYGRPNIGGDDLSKGANMAYNCALLWYLTNDPAYARKAIEILNAWSGTLWDFDYNDAKLLAAWTGHALCNAAEILRYTNAGLASAEVERFTKMLTTVYYPLMRFYYPQANGNWDGAIIHSLLAIAIFTDNRPLFDNAVAHFLHGPVNGGIFKYIYPSGQCQESTRDQAHVQLGLGEFAGAAQIAYTQGVDLFSIGNNRLALGYEYTAQFLLSDKPHSYGTISERARTLRDDYEYVYRHYAARGVDMPYTRQAADSVRTKASRSVLTAVRAPLAKVPTQAVSPKASTIGYVAGARHSATAKVPSDALLVAPGESLQAALDAAAGKNRWVVAKAGIHSLPTTLKVPSGVTLAGEGLSTILFLDPASGVRDALVNAEPNLHDFTLRDLVIEVATRTEVPSDPNSARSYRSTANRGGIMLLAQQEGQMKNITFENITVQNATYNGVFVSGATGLKVLGCDFNENGASIVPGPKLQHNLLLTHCADVTVRDSRLATSPHGSGLALGYCRDVIVANCEIARNAYYGLLVTESENIWVENNLIEANDRSGVMLEYLHQGSRNVTLSHNLIHYNTGHGLEAYAAKNVKAKGNTYAGNGRPGADPQKLSKEKKMIMDAKYPAE
ncbi:hypothetical protein GCM10027275_36410 [Rhabdobacter roseus]